MEIEKKINQVLNKIRPYLQNDGGNVEFLRYENGVAYVRLTGACSNCPLADHTLESGIESALINEIPEIIKVVEEPKSKKDKISLQEIDDRLMTIDDFLN